MATRTAEVKSYVLPDVKAKAAAVYEQWGMSLSDAVNTFLIKSIEVGGLPFSVRPDKPVYNKDDVLPIDPKYGYCVLPAEMDDPEDDIYESLAR